MGQGPLNSSAPTTSIVVGGVYNAVAPAPLPSQECALQLDASGNVLVNVAVGSFTLVGTTFVDVIDRAARLLGVVTISSLSADPLAPYKIQDEDSLALVKYFGFASSTNKNRWVILKQDTTTSFYTYRYANLSNNSTRTDYGAPGVTGAWVNRAALVYDFLYNLTGL